MKFSLDTAIQNGAIGNVINKDTWLGLVHPFDYSAITAALRLIPLFENIIGDQFCLTTDIDMIPVNKDWFNPMALCRYLIMGENPPGYGDSRYPICYLGMSKQDWLSIVTDHQYMRNIKGATAEVIIKYVLQHFNASMPEHLQFSIDELFIHNKLQQQPDFNDRKVFIGRDMITNPGYKKDMVKVPGILPIGRIDRSNWPANTDEINHDNTIDVHCMRPAYTNENWPRLKMVLEKFFDANLINKWETYRNEFVLKLEPLASKDAPNPPVSELSSII